jgi:hypothetical protein
LTRFDIHLGRSRAGKTESIIRANRDGEIRGNQGLDAVCDLRVDQKNARTRTMQEHAVDVPLCQASKSPGNTFGRLSLKVTTPWRRWWQISASQWLEAEQNSAAG